MLAVPDDLVGRSLVEAQTERRLALPHLTCDVVTAAKLVAKTLAAGIEDKTPDTAQSLCGEEFDLGVGIIRLDQSCGVDLDPLEINALSADGLTHLDSIASAVLAVGCGKVHQVRSVLGEQRLLGEVSTEATSGKNDWPVLLESHAALLVGQPHACSCRVGQQLGSTCLGNDLGLVRALSNLLNHLDQGIGDCHAREALLTTVSSWS
mmetsp:Transcript_72164/g.156669  ORF Transcript_72164/g.156669 Transcript_72164/m.156669 type:complete len:207 (-) Transcript_72164:441-1061(-)